MVTFQTSRSGVPANTSAEEQDMRAVVDAWLRRELGDVRVLHELALGDRRIDMVAVSVDDLVGVEVKGPKDRLDDRMDGQLECFANYLPVVWLVVHEKFQDSSKLRNARFRANVAVVRDGRMVVDPRLTDRRTWKRDDLCCSRLIERMWGSEVLSIARRCGIPHEVRPGVSLPVDRVRGLLARMLTGHEIIKEVCIHLRARTLTGMASDDPVNG